MNILRSPAFGRYCTGLACVGAGGMVSGACGSMLPLAMASAAAVLCTLPLVRQLRALAAQRRR